MSSSDFLRPDNQDDVMTPGAFAQRCAEGTFQEDGEGRELLTKYLLQGLQDEQRRLLEKKLRDCPITEEMTIIKVYQGRRAVQTTDAAKPHYLITNELNGCTATVVFAEAEDGTREAILTHFPDFMAARHTHMLKDLITETMTSAPKKSAVIFVHKNRTESLSQIQKVLSNFLEGGIKAHVVEYENAQKDDDGVVLVSIPSRNKGHASVCMSTARISL